MTRHHDDPLLTEAHAVEALFKSKVAANISIAVSADFGSVTRPFVRVPMQTFQARTALGPDALAQRQSSRAWSNSSAVTRTSSHRSESVRPCRSAIALRYSRAFRGGRRR